MNLAEIAERIDKHLKEAVKESDERLYRPRAYASSRFVYIVYVSYWSHPSHLSKADALKYLAFLDQHPEFHRHFSVLG